MTEIAAGLRLQLWMFRRRPSQRLIFVTIPFFLLIFLSGVESARKSSLAGYAVIAPAMIGLWAVSLDLGGSIIESDRIQQTFELLVIAPCSFSRVIAGRVMTITGVGMLTFIESVLFARLAFGVDVHIEQPLPMALTLVATAIAMSGTATAMATLFAAMRAARRFANTLGYPFYIIGGLLVPISFLPVWVRPLSWFIYLYWSTALLHASLSTQPIAELAWRLLAITGLGVAAYLIGLRLNDKVINALRRKGTIGLS
jgi:ABC-2 type transport system permease protein